MTDFFLHAPCSRIPDLTPIQRTAVMCAESNTTDAKIARAICSTCEFQRECLVWALDVGQEGCTNGGITISQRFLVKYRRVLKRLPGPAQVTLLHPYGTDRPGDTVYATRNEAAALVAAGRATLTMEDSCCPT